jgi:hypothetical protein
MKPDLHNYEAWLLDLEEGHLTPERELALATFLQEHPELRVSRSSPTLQIRTGHLVYPDKTNLLRSLPPAGLPSIRDLDDFLIARMEGDLGDAQERALAELLARDRNAASQWALMQRTRISAEPMMFAHKQELKRSTGRVVDLWFSRRVLALAASIALLLGVGLAWLHRAPAPKANKALAEVTTDLTELQPRPSPAATPSKVPSTRLPNAAPLSSFAEEVVKNDVSPALHAVKIISPAPVEDPELAETPSPTTPAASEPHALAAQLATVEPPPNVAPLYMPARQQEVTASELLRTTLRTEVLGTRPDPKRALDATDALAALAMGVAKVARQEATVSVERPRNTDRWRRIDLRVGNLSLSASR